MHSPIYCRWWWLVPWMWRKAWRGRYTLRKLRSGEWCLWWLGVIKLPMPKMDLEELCNAQPMSGVDDIKKFFYEKYKRDD